MQEDRIKSVINGRDPEVLRTLFSFYPRPQGKIVDLTCNTRKMWKGLSTKDVTFCDINPEVKPDIVCDFTKTPFRDGEVSTIIWDPPHLPSAAASDKSLQSFVEMYGLQNSVKAENIDSIFEPFLIEAKRILKDEGLIFVKLIDFVHNSRYQWTLVSFVNAINNVDGLTATDLIIKCDPSAGTLMSSKWKNAYHSRRSHCWWIIVRKGKCVPSDKVKTEPLGFEDINGQIDFGGE